MIRQKEVEKTREEDEGNLLCGIIIMLEEEEEEEEVLARKEDKEKALKQGVWILKEELRCRFKRFFI